MFLAIELNVLNALNYLIYFVLIITVLCGFLRGGKKSIYILIMMVLFFILYFVTLGSAVDFVWSYDLSQFAPQLAEIDPSLASFTSMEDSLESILGVALNGQVDLASASTEVINLATQLGKFIVKLVWTIAYFSVILVVYRIIVWFIGLFLVPHKKGQSRNRGIGAIAGGLNGLLAVYVLIVMLGGIHSMTESAVVLLEDSDIPEMAQVHELNDDNPFNATLTVIPMAEESTVLGDEQLQYLIDFNESFSSNFFVKIVSGITSKSIVDETVEIPAHLNLFDTVFSFEYNESVIALRYELDVLGEAGLVFLESDYATTNEITDITGNEIRQVFAFLAQSKLITSLAPVAIEVGSEMNDITLDITKADLYAIDFDSELTSLGEISGALFDIFNGAGVIGGEGDFSNLSVDGATIRGIFEDVSESEIILLMTDAILLPMLEPEDESAPQLINLPEDLDMEAEYLALGSIIAEIIDADVLIADLESGDPSILLNSISKVDLSILKNSELVSSALINILSGEYEIEGFDFIEVPTGIVWEDDGMVDGELTKILRALNVLTSLSSEIDFNNFDVSALSDLSTEDIDTFFNSYVLRATVSSFVSEMDLTGVALVFPDSIYDSQNYFTEAELKAVVEAVTLILDNDTGEFDIIEALNLTSADIDILLSSDIIYATIGTMIVDYGSTSLTIPSTVLTQIAVDSVNQDVITKVEIHEIFEALSILEITDFDTMDFGAGIISKLENSSQTALEESKINELLDSKILHASISNVIVDLSSGTGQLLVIPDLDVTGANLHTVTGGIDYISTTEIKHLLQAMYSIDITNFETMDLEDTSLILSNLDDMLISSIVQATVSKQILDLDTVLTIPETNVEDTETILIHQGSTTYILDTELEALFNVINMMQIQDPTQLSTTVDLADFNTETKQNTLLSSAIMHATISDTLISVGSGILIIPTLAEDDTPVKLEVGPAGNTSTFIAKGEIKAMLKALEAMNFTDINSFATTIDASKFLDNSALVLASASLQATVSDIILNSTAVTNNVLIVPDFEVPTGAIAIRKTKIVDNVTYISLDELTNFFSAVNELGITNFNSFSFESEDIFEINNLSTFFDSYIMRASASKYIIDVAGDETSAVGTTSLIVPTTVREAITVNANPFEQIEKTELINIFIGLDTLGMNNFSDPVDASTLNALNQANMTIVLNSTSFHLTMDNMIRGNGNVNTYIPALTEYVDYGLVNPILTKAEIIEFIEASSALGSSSVFTTSNFDYLALAAMTPADRDEVLDSMIVRNLVTDQLETMMTNDDPLNLYWPSNTYYELNDYNQFLTEAGINEVLSEYGLI